jgi:hypothetical protein
MSDRKSPSGPVSSVKGVIAIPSVPAATTALVTATGSFVVTSGPNVKVGDVISLSPQAVPSNPNFLLQYARVLSTGIVQVGFTNVGASSSQAALTYDANAATR